MKKSRKLPEIRANIAFHRQWIRRLEDEGDKPRDLAKANARLAELEGELALARKKVGVATTVPAEDPDHDGNGEPRVRIASV